MPELRRDPILDRWVVIAPERARRPKDFKEPVSILPEIECGFCREKGYVSGIDLHVVKDTEDGWAVKVIPASDPLLRPEGKAEQRCFGPYTVMDAIGRHEIVIETPDHIGNIAELTIDNISNVFATYRARWLQLENEEKIRSVCVFKNHGFKAGGGMVLHAHSQIIAYPMIPKRIQDELCGANKYYSVNKRCIYCDMVKQEIKERKRLIVAEEGFIALVPFAPAFPFDVWIIPQEHCCDFYKSNDAALCALAKILKRVLCKIKAAYHNPAYNYFIRTAPFRRGEGEKEMTIEDNYHWHIEISPRVTRIAGFEWGTGFYICSVTPEEMASSLRDIDVPL